ncbi:16S rRNA (guanine(527)-N(7))-methyltransferase RsmG [Xylanimonas protaetiae]|uniref:Ribosomal RNA small subunit methyltransferase G n=1 Tax=Xylanimonas protaetiae TaxID=2509457 RepID=A0A4P6F8C8_9MICO|nr:16S rRNA (guanine(527)-N(7))-methyltransferase RsmG [Xylanimonas protaetiae]QAY69527.1 16S rRNA (guanine(527)-N(7))-methyltransferase RsmG [Xylanimonas protaetiae]
MSEQFGEVIVDDTADRALGESPEVREYLGSAYDSVAGFGDLLREQGELRGLIGPREVSRLWERHLLNSAAVVPYLPETGTLVDVGSGAGLPGIVVAMLRPELQVVLIEPMERRTTWLEEVVDTFRLGNVDVRRGRAEEYHGAFEADVVTSRAVANLAKLARMSLPLVRKGGEMVVLKGRNVAQEIEPARKVLRSFKAGEPEILLGATVDGVEPTTILRVRRG